VPICRIRHDNRRITRGGWQPAPDYLTRRLISADFLSVPSGRFTWASFLISSLLFGAVHQQFVAGSLAGMFYALARYQRGKLTDAVIAHGVTNLLIAAVVLTTGNWSLWAWHGLQAGVQSCSMPLFRRWRWRLVAYSLEHARRQRRRAQPVPPWMLVGALESDRRCLQRPERSGALALSHSSRYNSFVR
jgi:Type II CAAX prenyl endopeptidase Rce1-like